ncbi:MAG: type II toxin-antitoxin system PemK/MazF family toxin [Candidatus Pacebacteria bacterium]|jgi:mRNA interferase MazF|nr:type II toxin-antitoxin system PemK/MazF family toxin [Candidatus Paceibacterota bacterium]
MYDLKEFDVWNSQKKKIQSDTTEVNFFPKEGEVWMSAVGRNIGYEQNGSGNNFSRPLLVIKKFNNHMFWCVPLSSKQKSFDFYFNFTDVQDQKVSLILAQMKLVSVRRFNRKMYEIPEDTLGQVRKRLQTFLT